MRKFQILSKNYLCNCFQNSENNYAKLPKIMQITRKLLEPREQPKCGCQGCNATGPCTEQQRGKSPLPAGHSSILILTNIWIHVESDMNGRETDVETAEILCEVVISQIKTFSVNLHWFSKKQST